MDFYEGSLVYDCFDNEEDAHAFMSEYMDVDLQKEIVDNAKNSCTISKEMKDEALKAFMLVMQGKGKIVESE